MGNTIRNQILSIFSFFIVLVGEDKDGVLESRVHHIAERISKQQIIAPANIDWQFR